MRLHDAGQVGAHGHALHGGHGADGREGGRPRLARGHDGGHGLRRRLEGRGLGGRGLDLAELHRPMAATNAATPTSITTIRLLIKLSLPRGS